MKIIDLFNKIAKGEELPKEVKYNGNIYLLDFDERDYMMKDCKEGLLDIPMIFENLNDEVEIIEEDKKIKNLIQYYDIEIDGKCFYEEGKPYENCIIDDAGIELLIDKIEELIVEVNKLKGKK